MTDARGYHKKGKPGVPARPTKFKFDKRHIVNAWEALSQSERARWDYNFEKYLQENKNA